MKDIKCEILDDYGEFDETDKGSTKVCSVKWNGKEPRGYDIRKYDKENERLSKGIIVSYDGMDELIKIIIENGLCDINKIKSYIKNRESKIFTNKDFDNMFTSVNNEISNYKRDNLGNLLSKDGHIMVKRAIKYMKGK